MAVSRKGLIEGPVHHFSRDTTTQSPVKIRSSTKKVKVLNESVDHRALIDADLSDCLKSAKRL